MNVKTTRFRWPGNLEQAVKPVCPTTGIRRWFRECNSVCDSHCHRLAQCSLTMEEFEMKMFAALISFVVLSLGTLASPANGQCYGNQCYPSTAIQPVVTTQHANAFDLSSVSYDFQTTTLMSSSTSSRYDFAPPCGNPSSSAFPTTTWAPTYRVQGFVSNSTRTHVFTQPTTSTSVIYSSGPWNSFVPQQGACNNGECLYK